MTYPALCRVRPPLQWPFDEPATLLHSAQVADLPCLGSPHLQKSLDRQEGQRRCLLDGWNSRPHSVHFRSVIEEFYRIQIRYECYAPLIIEFASMVVACLLIKSRQLMLT